MKKIIKLKIISHEKHKLLISPLNDCAEMAQSYFNFYKMKNQVIKIILLFLPALNGIAQNFDSGVYISFEDYQNNKLSYKTDCKSEKHAVNINETFNQRYITIKYNEEKIKLQKDSIYGIVNCDEPLVRFQNKEHYTLAEKGSIWIFYKEMSVPQSKGSKLEKLYYFSTTGDGKIIELSLENIKEAFPENHKLHDMIDAQFQIIDISEYDFFHKMFKINHLIIDSENDATCPVDTDVRGNEGDKCPKCGMNLVK